jgi:hypothetical protein
MIAAMGKALFVLAMPVVLFVVFGYTMMHLTGRDQFRSRAAEAVPLNYRLAGYDAAAAQAYWKWLGPEGRAAERRFLEADMAFPFLYGGALLASLLLAWAWLGRPFSPTWLVVACAIPVIADWCENTIHWQQLKRYLAGETVYESWIRIASIATGVKLVSFWVPVAIVAVLAVWLLFRPAGPATA